MANTTQDVNIPMSDLTQKITLNVRLHGVRVWALRMKLGLWLIKFAAQVMGVGVHVELERDEFERRDRRQSESK